MNVSEKSTNAMVPSDLSGLPSCQMGDDAIYDDMAQSATCLPRLVLYSEITVIGRRRCKPGHYGISESADEITHLGPSIDVLVLARRPKAMDMSDSDSVTTSFDFHSAKFKRIAAKSFEKDSSCIFGPSFLLIERNNWQRPLEFFCGTKSSRTEAKSIYPFLAQTAEDIKRRGLKDAEPHGPLPMTLSARLMEKGKSSWHIPVASQCTTPFATLLPEETIIKEITKFITATADDI